MELHAAKGQRDGGYIYDANCDHLTKLLQEGNIGNAEKEAGDYLIKLWHRASVGSLSTPELDRIPGQGQISITGIQADTLTRLKQITRELSRQSRQILHASLVRGHTYPEMESMFKLPKRHGVGKMLLIHCLRELAEVTGHAQRGTDWH